MSEKKFEDLYNSLRRLHDSANKAIEELQSKNKILEEEIIILNIKLINAQKNVDINKEIVKNALSEQNKMKDEFISEINMLRSKQQ